MHASPKNEPALSAFHKAEQCFRQDLPQLLSDRGRYGNWVLYCSGGLIEERPFHEERHFYQKYGSEIGTAYFLARIIADPPPAEVTPSWFTECSNLEWPAIGAQRRQEREQGN